MRRYDEKTGLTPELSKACGDDGRYFVAPAATNAPDYMGIPVLLGWRHGKAVVSPWRDADRPSAWVLFWDSNSLYSSPSGVVDLVHAGSMFGAGASVVKEWMTEAPEPDMEGYYYTVIHRIYGWKAFRWGLLCLGLTPGTRYRIYWHEWKENPQGSYLYGAVPYQLYYTEFTATAGWKTIFCKNVTCNTSKSGSPYDAEIVLSPDYFFSSNWSAVPTREIPGGESGVYSDGPYNSDYSEPANPYCEPYGGLLCSIPGVINTSPSLEPCGAVCRTTTAAQTPLPGAVFVKCE